MPASACPRCAFAAPAPLVHAAHRSRTGLPSSRAAVPLALRRVRAQLTATHVASSSAPPPPKGGDNQRSPDYWANVGTVIDTLREDYPHMLAREPELSIYAHNVVFEDRAGYRLYGMDAYKTIFWAIRMQASIFFSSSSVTIQSLYHDVDEGIIYLRWRVQATPRRWMRVANAAARRGSGRSSWVSDGMSTYKLNTKGMVAEHLLDNNVQNRSRLRPLIDDILAVGTVRLNSTRVGAGAGAPQWFKPLHLATYMLLSERSESSESDEDNRSALRLKPIARAESDSPAANGVAATPHPGAFPGDVCKE